jgi:hypothetical protein
MTQEHPGLEREERADNDNRRQKATTPVHRAAAREKKKPTLRQRWNDVQTSKTATFWLLAAAIVLTMIVGFTLGGWVTAGTSQKAASTTAQAAVIARLAPICVAQFNQDPQKDAKLVELQDSSSYQRGSYVKAAGWATMPGEDTPDSKVADACARLLMGQ